MTETEFIFAPERRTSLTIDEGDLYVEESVLCCDFCLDVRVKWEYPCEKFVIEQVNYGSDGNWLACEECSARIEAKDFGGLSARSVRSWILRNGDISQFQMDMLGLLHHGFLDHRTGPRFEYKEE